MWASLKRRADSWLNHKRRIAEAEAVASEARYRAAHKAHWDAVARNDTRALHHTRAELLEAQTDRLMREVWG